MFTPPRILLARKISKGSVFGSLYLSKFQLLALLSLQWMRQYEEFNTNF